MKKMKRGLAFVMALCMVLSMFMNMPVEVQAAQKTVTVRTQAQLDKALKSGKAAKIKIVTSKSVKLVIPKGKKTSEMELVINAPKATITNKSSFKKITIMGKGAKSYTEAGKGNAIVVSADSAKITVAKDASVKSLNLDGDKATVTVNSGSKVKKIVVAEDKSGVTLKVNGTVSAVKVTGDASKISIFGKSRNIPVTVTGDNASVTASTGVKLDVKSDAKITLKEGAEDTTVKATDDVKVKIANKTDQKVTVTTPSGETVVEAGQTVTDATAQDKPEDDKKPEDNTTDTPSIPVVPGGDSSDTQKDLSYEGYTLKWADEFDGDSLNRDDWNVELHEPGWVNAELQQYVDSKENIQVKDGNLVIQPVKTVDESGKATYTSGRVNTQGKRDYKYGLFEAKVKVPTGMGYLPAFWMMPTDENLYGQWPRCGEIDIMEVMGQDTKKAMGTIHYGNPHGQKQGEYVLKNGDFSSQWHTFSVEWEPGKIVWYVDGIKFHEANDWYSTTEGQGTVAYPAPFDQKFYMILNLAIGGSWVGYPDETTTYEDQSFVIDYVRAYQKSEAYYDELEKNVQQPQKPEVTEPENGIYVQNGKFATADDLSGKNGSVWEFMTTQNGEATAEVVSDNNFGENAKAVKISTTKAGTEDYSVQFVQANIPVKQGVKYKVTFDAYAASNRTMIVDVSAPDYNYARYLNDTKLNLTTEKQTYTYEFTVTDHDDTNARLEFNLGKTDPISDVYISNVKMEKMGTVEIDDSKKVMTDGNYISNGKFQEGTEAGKKYLQYWDITGADKAEYAVTDIDDGRRFKVTTKDCEAPSKVQLVQADLPLTAGNFELSFDAELSGRESADITVTVAGKSLTIPVTNTKETKTQKLTLSEKEIADNKTITFDLGINATVYLDNIRLVEDTLIKNGSFNADLAGFEVYAYDMSAVSYTVDSQQEDSAFDITIQDTNDADWKIQLKQNNVVLEKGQWYNLKFDIKSSIARKISYAIQRNGAVHKDAAGKEDWTAYVQNVVSLEASAEGKYQTVNVNFEMNYDTDKGSIFNIAMGAVGETRITDQHRICIDNISLTKIEEPEDVFPDIPAGTNLITNGDFSNGETGWNAYIKSEDLGTKAVEDGKIVYTVNDPGTEEWHVKLTQVPLTLEAGKKYHFTFKVTSSTDRKIKYVFQDPKQKYAWYGGETLDLQANVEKTVDYTVDLTEKETSTTIEMNVNMGILDFYHEDGTITTYRPEEAAVITLSDFSLTEITK